MTCDWADQNLGIVAVNVMTCPQVSISSVRASPVGTLPSVPAAQAAAAAAAVEAQSLATQAAQAQQLAQQAADVCRPSLQRMPSQCSILSLA